MTLLPAAERRSDRSGHWRSEPCPAELVVVADDQAIGRTFTCQRPQQWAGDRWPGHRLHIHRCMIDGKRVEITWQDDLNADSEHAP